MKLLGNRGKIQNSIIFEDVDLKIHDDVDENILEDGDKEVDKMKSKGNKQKRSKLRLDKFEPNERTNKQTNKQTSALLKLLVGAKK